MSAQPRLVIIGGPNGVGKTTFARVAAPLGSLRYLSADLVAQSEGFGEERAGAFRAGRLFTRRVYGAVLRGESLLVESTLSGQGTRALIRQARASGYWVSVVCLFVDSAESCVGRIRARVQGGGHSVPEEDVLRRFPRSLTNFWEQYRLEADTWHLAYNGGKDPARVAFGYGRRAVVLDTRAFEQFLGLVGR